MLSTLCYINYSIKIIAFIILLSRNTNNYTFICE